MQVQPHFEVTWFKGAIILLLGVGFLMLLAGVIVVMVLMAAKKPVLPLQGIKSAFSFLIWVLPAAAVVVYIARNSETEARRHQSARSEGPWILSKVIQPVPTPTESSRPEGPGGAPSQAAIKASSDGSTQTATLTSQTTHVSDEAQLHAEAWDNELAVRAAPGAEHAWSGGERLKIREIVTVQPQWKVGPQALYDGRPAVYLQSGRYITTEEAEQDITEQAAQCVKEAWKNEYPRPDDWNVPVAMVERFGVKNLVAEVGEHDFGGEIGKHRMYRAHLLMDLSPELHNAVRGSWRAELVDRRLVVLGSILGLVTLMFATSAAYFRLNDATAGQYRGRLKLASAAVIAAGSLIVAQIVT